MGPIKVRTAVCAFRSRAECVDKLRARAKDALGPKFDVRDFNDAVLETGSVPLDTLEKHIDAWITARR